MRQLQHVDVAHRYRLLKLFARHAVKQRCLARRRQTGRSQKRLDLFLTRAVEHSRSEPDAALHPGSHAQQHLVVQFEQLAKRRGSGKLLLHQFARVRRIRVGLDKIGDLLAQYMRGPAQVRFQNLAHVHTRRHAQRIQHNLHRGSIGQIRHVFLGKNARNHALVAVPARHLVAH